MYRIVSVALYSIHLKDQRLFEAFKKKGNVTVDSYSFFDNQKKVFFSKKELLIQEFICLGKLLKRITFFRNAKVFCTGGHFSFLVLNKIFGVLLGKDFHLYLYNFYIHSLGDKKIIKSVLHYLFNNDNVTLIVQSPREVDYYSLLSKNKVFFVPYCTDINIEKNKEILLDLPFSDYFFTGGYTNRDYPLMLECARKFPLQKFIIVASNLNCQDFSVELPQNVYMFYNISNELFLYIMNRAKCVIIPLKEDVGASGQLLCVDAIRLKKPVIYCDITSINYYFELENGCLGFPYKINNIGSMCFAINTFLEKTTEEIDDICKIAFENFNTYFSIECRNKRIVDIIFDSQNS